MRELYEPFVRTGQPDPGDGSGLGRADQVRGERDARHAHLVHERDREPLQQGGRGRAQRPARDGHRRRIGSSFLFPGLGYGGSCFPKDVKALVRTAQGPGRRAAGGRRRRAHQRARRRRSWSRAWRSTWAGSQGKVIAVWGLAFKPRTDDMREAPALAVIEALLEEGAKVRAYDPKATEAARAHARRPRHLLPAQLRGGRGRGRAGGRDGVERVPRARLRAHQGAACGNPAIFDGRNIYNPDQLRELGFHYEGIGRG